RCKRCQMCAWRAFDTHSPTRLQQVQICPNRVAGLLLRCPAVGKLEPGTQPVEGVAVELARVESNPVAAARRGRGIGRARRCRGDGAVEMQLDPRRAEDGEL